MKQCRVKVVVYQYTMRMWWWCELHSKGTFETILNSTFKVFGNQTAFKLVGQ